ncbi:MAG: metallophosphoesterase [Candidatus Abyssubacteria bacterium]
MSIKLVSDIHGAHEALSAQLDSRDTLIMLGDYANLLDFETLEGIITDILTKPRVMRVMMQVARGEMEEAEELVRELTLPEGKYYDRAAELLAESYTALFESIPCESYLLFGNNDFPDVLEHCRRDNVRILNGEAVTIEGLRFGLVSGSPPHSLTLSLQGSSDHDTFSARVAALGPVDVLCSHVPPSGLGLEYDVIMARDEASSEALSEHIRTYKPSYAFHGHVHNPGKETATLGPTRIMNLGYFRRHGKVLTLQNAGCSR